MDWFYSRSGEQAGPVTEEELQRLAQEGVVTPDSLVWHSGMGEWKSYRDTIPPPMMPAGAQAAFHPPGLAQGVGVPVGAHYGGFWIRFLAVVIDGLALGAVNLGVSAIMRAALGNPFDISEPMGIGSHFYGVIGFTWLINLAIGLGYQVYFLTKFAATPGKLALGLKVITTSGAPISTNLALARYFACVLDSLILLIGYIIAAFDAEKRALHDRLCDTRVIYAK